MRPFQTNQAAPRGLHRAALLLLGLFTVAWVPQSAPQRVSIRFESGHPGLTLELTGPERLTLQPQQTATLTVGSYALEVRTPAGVYTEPQLDLARLLRPYPTATGLLVQALVVDQGVDLTVHVGLEGGTRQLLYQAVLAHTPAHVPAAPEEDEYDTFGGEPAGIMTHEAPATAPQKTTGIMRRRETRTYPSTAAHDTPQRNHPDSGGEEFGKLTPNAFKAVGSDPLSTFSIDVDRASYAFVRNYLQHGSLPPVDAVRTEELVNYFSYAYPRPQPGAEHPFSVTTEVATCPWAPTHQLVRIGLAAQQLALENLPPANLVFLLDVSGSMSDADKLPLLKGALRLLVPQLRAQDRVAIVVYAGAAGLVLPSTPATQHQTILDALDRLEAGGSTAGGAGIELAYRVAQENLVPGGNNRVILCTDGDFNVGTSSESGLTSLIEAKRKTGVFLTVLGFGRGNTKDNFMELLAD
ncbi:MAG: von Willebrand factor type A domain-containing protein, partial [Bacteroidia bacterium]|nr:von Willebrand factor type A domain-containing protein [Bacteroidia bacterium]